MVISVGGDARLNEICVKMCALTRGGNCQMQ